MANSSESNQALERVANCLRTEKKDITKGDNVTPEQRDWTVETHLEGQKTDAELKTSVLGRQLFKSCPKWMR